MLAAGEAALLLGAGLVGGMLNAVAGGATLITFPALLAVGLPPVVANASNALALTPGHLLAALADRAKLPPARALALPLLITLACGIAGAVLLLATPARLFIALVPALIGFATLVFALGPALQRAARARAPRRGVRLAGLAGGALYGGYFGAGLGVMLLALLVATGPEAPREANAVKNVLSTAAGLAAVLVLASAGTIAWGPALTMLAGAFAGGYLGGRLIAILPARAARAIVVTAGSAMTAAYAWRYWG